MKYLKLTIIVLNFFTRLKNELTLNYRDENLI